jgi:hypothetical protein
MSEEKSFSGVDALIERMELYPEEFFENGDKRSRWTFMYKDYFRDALTESEKGRIHEAVRKMRRLEFDATVLKELMKDEVKESETTVNYMKDAKNLTSSSNTVSGWWDSKQLASQHVTDSASMTINPYQQRK